MAFSDQLQSDAELVDQVKLGDSDAYALLVRRYERQVRASALHIVHDSHTAEDVAQEAFLAAYRSLHTLRRAEHFSSWLLTITRRQAGRFIRSTVRKERSLTEDEVEQADAAAELSGPACELLDFVERLPNHERIVVGLRYFDGRSVQDIADILDRPTGTVTKQLSRAHRRLKQWLSQVKQ